MSTVADWFHHYQTEMMAADSPPMQIAECRRAFYAGVFAMLIDGMEDVANTPEDAGDDDVDALAVLQRFKDECIAYMQTLKPGYSRDAGRGKPTRLIVVPPGFKMPES